MKIDKECLEKFLYELLGKPLLVAEDKRKDTIYYKMKSEDGITLCVEYKKDYSLSIMVVNMEAAFISGKLLESLSGFLASFPPVRIFDHKHKSDFPLPLTNEEDFIVNGYSWDI